MIGTLDIKCFAAKPQMPLQPMFAFAGSPSSIRVMDVPKKIGDWEITGVKVAVTYPDNRTIEKSAVRTGSVWVATLEGSEIAGKVGEGFSVVADGIDEDGNEVTGYVLGKGDVFILENRNDIKSLVDKVAVRFLEDMPTNPAAGDMIEFNGILKFYDGEKWVSVSTPTKLSQLENDVGYITESAIPSDVSAFNNDVGYITASAVPTKVSELENDAGYITESAIPSDISAFNNDVGYLTASSTEFTNKRDYDDQTFPMPSDVTLIPFVNDYDNERWARAYVQKFDVTYDGVGHELSEFIIHPEYGMMWYKASTLFMATRDGETFYLRDNNTNIMATTTISALKSGVVDFTYDGKSGSITLFAREKTNFALDYQTINGNLVLKANGTTVGLFNPQNPIESVINIPVPSNVSQLNNDADFMSAQAVSASYYSKAETNTLLSAKQNALPNSQLEALACTTGEHQTVVTYADHTTQTFDIYGDVSLPAWRENAVDVKFGTGVTSLGFGALEGATTLQSVTIPESVTSIAMHAFFSCPNLHTLVIPESVTSIDQDTFDSSGLTSILFKGRTTTEVQQMANYPWGVSNTSIISGQLFEETEARNNALDLTVEEYKTKIDFNNAASMAFDWYGEITKQTMIDEGLFDDDPLRDTWIKNPDVIVFGPGVTSIGAETFFSASSSHVEIPRTVTSIGLNAFYTSAGPEQHEFIFKDRTLAEVQAMENYPWGINDTTQIKTWNDTSKEYVDSLVGDIDTALDSINGEII